MNSLISMIIWVFLFFPVLYFFIIYPELKNKKKNKEIESKAKSKKYKVFLDGNEVDPIGIDYYTIKYRKVVNEEDKTIIITSRQYK